MAGPLLETKLYVPSRRRGVVPRPRLSERLNCGAESKLTLVSAPAGFGKSALREAETNLSRASSELARLETLALMAGLSLPYEAIAEQARRAELLRGAR